MGNGLYPMAIKKIVIGRDGRISGPSISKLVAETLTSLGAEVIDLGLSTTPTVEMEVIYEKSSRRHHHHSKSQSKGMECPEITERKR